jgi:hypothetical protein
MFILVSLTLSTSCTKDAGFEGKASIKGSVTYPGGAAPFAIVQIAFDTKSATEDFDYTTASDASGNYSINQLSKGDYYVDAQYTDPMTGLTFHTAGYAVEIGGNKEDVTVDIVLQ